MPLQKLFNTSCLALAFSLAAGSPLFAQSPARPVQNPDAGSTPLTNNEAGTLNDDIRLETIGYRISTANANACDKPVMHTGLLLHDLASYAASERPQISQKYELTYGFGILGVAPGSVAEQAGLRGKDEILAVNGQDLTNYEQDAVGTAATFNRVAAFTDYLSDALQQGPTSLLIKRGNQRISMTLTGKPGCGGYVTTVKSMMMNAWSDGHNVAVTLPMMHYTVSDDELAFIVAHEMSHNLLGHYDRLKRRWKLLATIGLGSGAFRKSESEADQYAMHLLYRTSYDVKAPERLLARLNGNVLLLLSVDFTHPTLGRRITLVRAALAHEETSHAVQLAQIDASQSAAFNLAATPQLPRHADNLLDASLPTLRSIDLASLNTLTTPAAQQPYTWLAKAPPPAHWLQSNGMTTNLSLSNENKGTLDTPPYLKNFTLGFLSGQPPKG